MTPFQRAMLAGAWMLSLGAVVAIAWPIEPKLPMVPIEQTDAFMDECVDKGGWHASSGYINQDTFFQVCYGLLDGHEVVLDVNFGP